MESCTWTSVLTFLLTISLLVYLHVSIISPWIITTLKGTSSLSESVSAPNTHIFEPKHDTALQVSLPKQPVNMFSKSKPQVQKQSIQSALVNFKNRKK